MAEAKKKTPAKKSTAKKAPAKTPAKKTPAKASAKKKAPAKKRTRKPSKPTYAQVYKLRIAWEDAQDNTAFYARGYNRAQGIGIEADIEAAGDQLLAAKKAEADAYAAFKKARS